MSKNADREGRLTLRSLYRSPMKKPLATLVATLIVGAFGYQAYMAAQQFAPWVGLLVLATGYLAYRIARLGWRFQHDFIEAEMQATRCEEISTTQDAQQYTRPEN